MGLMEKFKIKSSKDDDDNSIKLPPINSNNYSNTNFRIIPEESSLNNVKNLKNTKVIKIENSKLMMKTMQIVQDSIFDFLTIVDLIQIESACHAFNEMVVSYFESRNAVWWARAWQIHFLNEMDKEIDSNYQSVIGTINSRTENTSTRNTYTASRNSIEEIENNYPFVYSNNQNETTDDTNDEPNDEYYGQRNYTELVIDSKQQIDQLFENGGFIQDATHLKYSSSGKSGSADGIFSIPLINLIDFKENIPSHSFSQREKHERSPIVLTIESFLRKFFKLLLNNWWLASRNQKSKNQNTNEEQLILTNSHISRKQQRGYDKYGPVYSTENIKTFSIRYRAHNTPETILCSLTNVCSYYG
ncbi:predicted protein [Naegleria gruberi]|uniref:Predicted protein n=1 Tax=Naegleria gruberi TaxID=5762 RepID=D2VNT1_NAEGR|nr:uncharacterized protein NAEGRDRAFT_70608 [Naegleria gruberi]EFC41467.1 predicted protein [Naegleria gruberi]|eukprot:XP_002674211.1 predicted protein [Naegleria gruberi strain NEG-M]